MFSPSASKSTTPRSARPISRWISTVRPSGRPLVTSRCLRSPVDAGSIPYSAVTQPRPLPAIQRGTLSWAEAVQMTRVSPTLISADPVAVRDEAGLDRRRAQVVRRRGRRSASSVSVMRRSSPREAVELDVLDLAERHLQEARAQRAERVGVAGAQEAVVALAGAPRGEVARAERVLDLARERGARGDDRRRRGRACAGASGGPAGSACSRGSRCRRRPRAAARRSRGSCPACRSSNDDPSWISGARSGHGTEIRSTCGSAAATASA